MFQALLRTVTEILDSKKAAYSFLAVALAVTLHLYFGVSPQNALLLVSPLGLATVAQAHVEANAARNTPNAAAPSSAPAPAPAAAAPAPAAPAPASA